MTGFDPAAPRLKPRLAQGPAVGAVWCTLGAPVMVEVACRFAPDLIVIDMQHGLFDRPGLEVAVGLSTVPVAVRTRDDHPASIGEALDAGAEGVIVPLIESAEAAAAVASSCRYPPDGHRSGGGVRPLADMAAHAAHANAGVVAGVMIETERGVEAASEIAASGVDLVFIGTGDLALSLSVAPGSPDHEAACETVRTAAQDAGIPCGIFAMDAGSAAARAAAGYHLSVAAIDLDILAHGIKHSVETFRAAPLPAPKVKSRARRRTRTSVRRKSGS
ncbi:MAG: aldolase/citrate lyase family protein [Pseudomonadota bacterium]